MDSNELAQLLRERAALHHLRLIAMTSSRQHVGREVARNAGFERYLLKPIAAADLSGSAFAYTAVARVRYRGSADEWPAAQSRVPRTRTLRSMDWNSAFFEWKPFGMRCEHNGRS